MKKIIVPIDFSEHSEFALKAAVKLAKRNKGKIFLKNTKSHTIKEKIK